MSDQRLFRRKNGVYYYRRRVPLDLVEKFGKEIVQLSLHTTSLNQAKKQRTLRDLEWDARFEAARPTKQVDAADKQPPLTAPGGSLGESACLELVRAYVERHDREAQKRETQCCPITAEERREMQIDAEVEAQSLRARDDLQHQWVHQAGSETLKAAGKSFGDPDVPGELLAEVVRRGLLELNRRHRSRLADDHSRSFFDQLFDPTRPADVTFGKLADQHLQIIEEDGAINALGAKGLDRQRATIALIREIVGDKTPVHAADFDSCRHVRTILARLPANRTKLYGDLPIEQAIERAAKEGRHVLSPVTQERYLAGLRDILDLAAKKGLISSNPAEGLRPIKRDALAASEKRKPFTLQQIADFFKSPYYAECAEHQPPFANDKTGWRFWLALLCLFLGMRPNEAAQLHVGDLKCTEKGTWYLDIEATADEDEESNGAIKTLKTATSRRKIPLHPELVKIGFVKFVEQRKKASIDVRLFPDLKHDTYGNYATYALKRFREVYLPDAIKVEARQSFYSFRHSWRDALRRSDAPPATLQALGAWSQGKLTSDDYGDKSDPDYQLKYMKQVSFPGLDLSPLYLKSK